MKKKKYSTPGISTVWTAPSSYMENIYQTSPGEIPLSRQKNPVSDGNFWRDDAETDDSPLPKAPWDRELTDRNL